MSYVVTVRFTIAPGRRGAFLPQMVQNAQASLTREPGCLVFDVCTLEDPDAVFLYEVYTDRAAFEAHLASDHFKAFDAATSEMVVRKEVQLGERIGGTA